MSYQNTALFLLVQADVHSLGKDVLEVIRWLGWLIKHSYVQKNQLATAVRHISAAL